jgi:hypothetical protein
MPASLNEKVVPNFNILVNAKVSGLAAWSGTALCH